MSRIEALRAKLSENKVDALIIASGINRRYVTGE